MNTLIEKYHFKPEIIFSILRKQSKKIYELSNEEYINNIKMYKDIYDNYIRRKKSFLENEFDAIYVEKDLFINEFYKPIWNSISPEFYFIFNSLELNDIYFPEEEYNKQINDLNNKLKQGKDSIEKIKTELEGLSYEKNNLVSHHKSITDFLDKKLMNSFSNINNTPFSNQGIKTQNTGIKQNSINNVKNNV